ncbi:DUF6731 family protein [Serratia surfactantfaciens]|uniref:DUF6731 family protein n=1 Tax=Serratia surfactantfaciens TaxID=2741499 RepID=UPI003EE071E3
MTEKNYKVEFFQLSLTPNREIDSFETLFELLENDDDTQTALNHGGYTREIWGLRNKRNPRAIYGQFRKFRTTDIPEIGKVGGQSQEIELDDNEGLIERNFFAYYVENDIVAWHKNSHSSSINQFAGFLSAIADCKISAAPILQADAIGRLMSGDVTLKKIEFTLPRPTNPDLYPADNYGRGMIDLMNGVDADSLKVTMGVDLRRADTEGKMSNRLKDTLRALVQSGATTARAYVFDEGIEHPIDLIADRVFSIQQIETDAHFPPAITMYNLLDTAKAECQEGIDDYFGEMGRALD